MVGGNIEFAFMVFTGVFALVVFVYLGAAYLAYRHGSRIVSGVMMLGLMAAAAIPPVLHHLDTAQVRNHGKALTIAPEGIDLAGRRVLFVRPADNDFGACGAICADALELGSLSQVYGTFLFDPQFSAPEPHNPFAEIERRSSFFDLRDGLDGNGYRQAGSDISDRPEVDFTVVTVSHGHLRSYARYFGLEGISSANFHKAYLIYEGWPEGEALPVARLVTTQNTTKPFLVWPLFPGFRYDPPLGDHRALMARWMQ